jgi:acetylornithine deacetylase
MPDLNGENLMFTDLEQRALDAINLDGLLSFLSDLIAAPSVNGTEEENAAQRLVADKMSQLGMEVDCWELDFEALRRHPAYSVECERPHGLGVVGSLGRGQGKSLIYNGHVDVVPVDDLSYWHFPPWQGTLANGRMYGRGALDMKGGLCCALFAAKALRDAGISLKGRLHIQSVIGEEDGGVGTLGAILRGYKADGAVIMEPTQMMVSPAQAGALNFRVTVEGKTAHGSIRDEGVSAIEKFIPLHEALLRFEAERNARDHSDYFPGEKLPFALNIGNIKGGQWASNVPENLVFEGRYGIAPDEDAGQARRDLEAALRQAAARDPWLSEHSPKLEWWGAQFLPASTPLDDPIVSCVSGAFSDAAGTQPVLKGMPYGADMRLLVNEAYTPTVLFGPGDIRNAHQPDEFVPVEDLLVVTRVLAITAMRFCGV